MFRLQDSQQSCGRKSLLLVSYKSVRIDLVQLLIRVTEWVGGESLIGLNNASYFQSINTYVLEL